MVDERIVRKMTKIAIYEKHETKGSIAISRYYKNDYVRYNVLKTWVAVTVAFWMIVGSYVYMSFDKILADINAMDYFNVMYSMLGRYVMVCLIYFVAAFWLYSYRYEKARPGLVAYNSNLRDLIELLGGPAHRKKKPKKIVTGEKGKGAERIRNAIDNAEVKNDPFASVISIPNTRVNRAELLKQREMERQKEREDIIKQNVRLRNERLAAQNEMKIKRQQMYEQNKKEIQEKRKQLERMQMERMKAESMNRLNRQNHTYNSDSKED